MPRFSHQQPWQYMFALIDTGNYGYYFEGIASRRGLIIAAACWNTNAATA